MTTKRSYKIEQDGENFVLVETSDTYGNPVVRVPYSIQQEAESGIIAVSKSHDFVKTCRKKTALDVARGLTDFFIKSDVTAESLLKIRQRVEILITASIAEIRKNAGIPTLSQEVAEQDMEPSNKDIMREVRRNRALARGGA
ncbi:hypothetical protein ASN_1951 [Acetobacter senegalensis]|uniref:Uncharacterized protein n=1 Tax=Acetobacter senegalensis TaxID=446692 RepID=A0A0U5BA80_9PROT|nr:hypothetical protein [Acetobacter senegalensis]CEF41266.1 hypothetical protein ASN_1951 [Acetobacter senegalensis]